jgi:hypothetical protein
MSDGTPLEDLETGAVEHTADASRMNEILADMNASGAVVAEAQAPPMGGMMQPMPPMQQQMYNPQMMAPPPPRSHYIPVDEPVRPRKKNTWSSVLDGVRDPIFVAVLFFVLSLPVLHTFAAKHIHWAFAVGGQFSWIGLAAFSALAGMIFGLLKGVSNMLA